MKTIVYPDGSIEASVNARAIVARGDARYATQEEEDSYEELFYRSDEPILDNPGYRGCNCEDYPCCGH